MKCLSQKGIQLEISRGLRDQFFSNKKELEKFCETIEKSL